MGLIVQPMGNPILPSNNAIAVSAAQYTFEQLADIYNQARVDYIVPMPMNAKRMAEYVRDYDIDLDASVVSLNGDGQETGVCMLGVRGERAWITRLGVIPERRGHRLGQFLMERMLENAQSKGCSRVQLEVIQGNEPAIRLFHKLGFTPTRELLIVRRPPGAPPELPDYPPAQPMTEAEIADVLSLPRPEAAWTEESASLLNAGGLCGARMTFADGESGWLIHQRQPFQITHISICDRPSRRMLEGLLYSLHSENPTQDTKTENVPVDSAVWPVMQEFGYFEVFRRTEMILPL
ncbi:MAG: hypothetical protein OHK0023_07110 [Anaerolineae bacterium]